MTKISENMPDVKPIRFELVDNDSEITLGDVILGSMDDLINHKIIPEYLCRRCGINYTFEPDDFCEECIEDVVEGEG